MSIPVPYGETITLVRTGPGGQDDYGNDVDTETIIDVPGVAVWPRESTEQGGDRDTVIIGLSLLVPPGVQVKATDRIRVRGGVWDVEGEPGHWRSYLTGTDAGTQVALRRVEG